MFYSQFVFVFFPNNSTSSFFHCYEIPNWEFLALLFIERKIGLVEQDIQNIIWTEFSTYGQEIDLLETDLFQKSQISK